MIILKEYFDTSTNNDSSNTRGGDGSIVFGYNSDDSFILFGVKTSDILNFLGDNSNTTDFEAAGDIDLQDLNTAYLLTLELGECYSRDITTGNTFQNKFITS